MSYFKSDQVLIVAEAGKNFIINDTPTVAQCLDEAKTLAHYAKQAGADIVKFQTHVFEDEARKRDESRHEWTRQNESVTPYDEFWVPLKAYCDEIGITFMTSAMSKMAAQKVNNLVEVWKVGSGDTVDFEMLEYMASTGKPMIVSTGLSTMEEVRSVVSFLKARNVDFALLQCTSIYPCPISKLHLNVIETYQEEFGCPVGFSDHSTSLTVAIRAVQKGARIIEKHFTINKTSKGPDHFCSLDTKELHQLVQNIRITEEDMFADGSSEKTRLPEEEAKHAIFRK